MASTGLLKKKEFERTTRGLHKSGCGWAWRYTPDGDSRFGDDETYYSFVPEHVSDAESNLYRRSRLYAISGNTRPEHMAEFGVAFEILERGQDCPFARFVGLMEDPAWRAYVATIAQRFKLTWCAQYNRPGKGERLKAPDSLLPDRLELLYDVEHSWSGYFLGLPFDQTEFAEREEQLRQLAEALFPLLLAVEARGSSGR